MKKKFELIQYIAAIYRHQTAVLNHNITESGITAGTYPFLISIERDPGLSLMTLSKYLLIDRATTTKAVTKLLKSELIEKIPDDKDKRAFNLYLTPKGEDACKVIKVEAADFLKEMVKGIPEEEYLQTINTLDQVLKNIKNMHNEIKKV